MIKNKRVQKQNDQLVSTAISSGAIGLGVAPPAVAIATGIGVAGGGWIFPVVIGGGMAVAGAWGLVESFSKHK